MAESVTSRSPTVITARQLSPSPGDPGARSVSRIRTASSVLSTSCTVTLSGSPARLRACRPSGAAKKAAMAGASSAPPDPGAPTVAVRTGEAATPEVQRAKAAKAEVSVCVTARSAVQ